MQSRSNDQPLSIIEVAAVQSSRRLQAAEALRRARRLPVGPHRNDLRQLAVGLLWLDKHGIDPTGPRSIQANH
jgi:hypothetical protein